MTQEDSGKDLQTLTQLQATGADVLGSDGEKVGDLKEVRDADFTVGRGLLKKDLDIPVSRVAEISDSENVILDVPAGEVESVSLGKAAQSDPHADFAQNAKVEKGGLGLFHNKDE